jgi:hypothetical protein
MKDIQTNCVCVYCICGRMAHGPDIMPCIHAFTHTDTQTQSHIYMHTCMHRLTTSSCTGLLDLVIVSLISLAVSTRMLAMLSPLTPVGAAAAFGAGAALGLGAAVCAHGQALEQTDPP